MKVCEMHEIEGKKVGILVCEMDPLDTEGDYSPETGEAFASVAEAREYAKSLPAAVILIDGEVQETHVADNV